MFGIERGAKEVGAGRHLPVIGFAISIGRRSEEARDGGMACDGMSGVGAADRLHAGLQIAGELVIDEGPPIEIVRVRKDSRKARRLYLVPHRKAAVPSGVERIQRLIF